MQPSMTIEYDVDIPMRDGLSLSANVFRPSDDQPCPVIMTLGPYPKDIHFADWDRHGFYEDLEEQGEHMHWESVNPDWWVPQGYVVLRVDARGTGKSPGSPTILSNREAQDYCDAIEWAGTRSFSTGRVALMGISYFAMNAWRVAALNPPHLAAVVPWEGALDMYRDVTRHGGIASNNYTKGWSKNVDKHVSGDASVEQVIDETIDERTIRNHPDVGLIEAPLLSAANWGGAGLHLRGNVDGYQLAGSAHKQLRIHVGNHCAPFYSLESRLEQLRFLEHWLKGVDTGITKEPPIKLAVRTGGDEYFWRYEYEWPLARTDWTTFFVDTSSATLSTDSVEVDSIVSYDAGDAPSGDRVTFQTPMFETRTEFTGPAMLKLWVSAAEGDADLMVRLRHLRADGTEVLYPAALPPAVSAAYGWLRVSHRKLDKARSTPWRPVLAHDEIRKTEPNEIVPVFIEILPTSMVLQPGERLELEVAAQDDPNLIPFIHTDPDDRMESGTVSLHAGPNHDSHLLMPLVPART